jgi:hypothetical protein
MGKEAWGACWTRKPARTHERKKRRSKRLLALEVTSPLQEFFTGGVEYDERLDLGLLDRFLRDFEEFVAALDVSPDWGRGIEIKFRRLGKHRADGLFYPDRSLLVMDVGSCRSFAHEFGHLMDYGAGREPEDPPLGTPVLSAAPEFEPVHRLFLERLHRVPESDPRICRQHGRLTRAYFASPSECFARAFEQCAAEWLHPGGTLAGERERYRADPLFLPEPSPAVLEYYRRLLGAGPAEATAPPASAVQDLLCPAKRVR